jgi:hypothetical protein
MGCSGAWSFDSQDAIAFARRTGATGEKMEMREREKNYYDNNSNNYAKRQQRQRQQQQQQQLNKNRAILVPCDSTPPSPVA